MLETPDKPGAVAVGTRTMQEGGALGPWTREQVRVCGGGGLFCFGVVVGCVNRVACTTNYVCVCVYVCVGAIGIV